MNIQKYIDLATTIRKNIDEHGARLWKGFEPVPFILYNDEFQIAIGSNWPSHYKQVAENIWVATGKDDHLFANTCIKYHGQIVAIWDVRSWSEDVDVALATAHVYHEMFHAHQHNLNLGYGNFLLGMTYSHTVKSVALTIAENELLLDILENPEPDNVLANLNGIANLRAARQDELGKEYIEYDQGEETGEGTAAYVEIKMAATISDKAIIEVAPDYLQALRKTDDTLAKYRARLYTVGMVFCFACDYLKLDLQQEMAQSGSTVFAWLSEKLNLPVEVVEAKELDMTLAERLVTAFNLEKEEKINAFLAQSLVEVEGEQIVFDPMNIVCHQGRCLHMHGRFKVNGVEQQLDEPFLVEFEGNISNIKRMFLLEKNRKN